MEYITVSAKTVDDAITEALIQLGVTSDKLDYEVIEKGSAGFLGIGMKQARRAVSLEPMNPYERRIIHSALQADPAVSTHSEGEEPYRRVVVTLVRR